MSTSFRTISDNAEYYGANWTQQVNRINGATLQQAQDYAASNDLVTFFFRVNDGQTMVLPNQGTFNSGDSVFFTGPPWYAPAPGLATSYEKINVMSGVETINFNSANPPSTSHLSIQSSQNAPYSSQYNSWQIGSPYNNAFVNLALNLPESHSVTLILTLCSGLVNGSSNCPIQILVNGAVIGQNWDPHNGNFYKMAWTIPKTNLNAGNNTIQIQLQSTASTTVFLQAAAVMTFAEYVQSQSNWCWDATGVSLARFLDPNSGWTQCLFANKYHGQTTCCTNPGSTQCNQGGWPQIAWPMIMTCTASPLIPHGTSSTGTPTISPTDLQNLTTQFQNSILSGIPVGCDIRWWQSNGTKWWDVGGHIVVVTGLDQSLQYVSIEDPALGYSFMSLATFVNAYNGSGLLDMQYFTNTPVQKAPTS